MFGYVKPFKDELRVREYNTFKGYYCGLCKEMGRNFNQLTRLSLNYDLTFLGLLLSSLDDKMDTFKRENCITSPFTKKPIVQSNKHLKYNSEIGVILVYYNLIDDIKDEKSIKSLLALPSFYFPYKKARKLHIQKTDIIKKSLDKLQLLEKEKCDIIDKSADTFANIMKEIAVPEYITDEKIKRILGWFGYNLGRWIYILDAFDDLEEDVKKNSYNPMLLQYKYENDEDIKDFKKRIVKDIDFTLIYTMDNIVKSFQLLDIKYNKEIIENIIYLGMRKKMESILNKGGQNNGKPV